MKTRKSERKVLAKMIFVSENLIFPRNLLFGGDFFETNKENKFKNQNPLIGLTHPQTVIVDAPHAAGEVV